LLAAVWPVHVHHTRAREWLSEQQAAGWATCPLTQAGFVRVSSNPAVFHDALTPAAALAVLDTIVAAPGHRWLADDVDFASSPLIHRAAVVSHRQVSDAHLLAIALQAGFALATFDRQVVELLPPGQDEEFVTLL
jgi:toxin-antitoxin system PIN domain toxin